MIDPLEVALGALGSVALLGIGRLLRTLDANTKLTREVQLQVVGVKAKLDNGITHTLQSTRRRVVRISKSLDNHIATEEERIRRIVNRNPALRTRRTDHEREDS